MTRSHQVSYTTIVWIEFKAFKSSLCVRARAHSNYRIRRNKRTVRLAFSSSEINIVISAQSVYCGRLWKDIELSLLLEGVYSMSLLFREGRTICASIGLDVGMPDDCLKCQFRS